VVSLSIATLGIASGNSHAFVLGKSLNSGR